MPLLEGLYLFRRAIEIPPGIRGILTSGTGHTVIPSFLKPRDHYSVCTQQSFMALRAAALLRTRNVLV